MYKIPQQGLFSVYVSITLIKLRGDQQLAEFKTNRDN